MAFFHRLGVGEPTTGTSWPKTISTLAGGGVLWVAVSSRHVSGPVVPTLTMTGATFVQVQTVVLDSQRRLTLFYSKDYGPGTSVTLTLGFGAQSSTSIALGVEEQIPGERSGDPVAQLNTVGPLTGTTAGITGTLTAGPGEQLVVAGASGLASAAVPATGTELTDHGYSSHAFLNTSWDHLVRTNPGIASFQSAPSVMALISVEATAVAQDIGWLSWVRGEVPDVSVPAQVTGITHRANGSSTGTVIYMVGTIPYLRGGGLLWLSVVTQTSTNAAEVTPTMEGATFSLLHTGVYDTNNARRLSVFFCQDYEGPINNQLVGLRVTGTLVQNIYWSVEEQYPGRLLTHPIVQVQTAVQATNVTTHTTTLASGSGWMLVILGHEVSAGGATPGTGTELVDVANIAAYWDSVVRTNPTITTIAPGTSLMVALEAYTDELVTDVTVNPAVVASVLTVPTPALAVFSPPAVVTPASITASLTVPDPTTGLSVTLIPIIDTSVGVWTTDTGATTGLYAAVADRSESNYIQSPMSPADSPVTFALTPGSDPGVNTGHVVSWSHRNTEPGDVDLTVELRQGYVSEASQGTLIASWTTVDLPGSFTTRSETLTAGQAGSITDYGALSLRFIADET